MFFRSFRFYTHQNMLDAVIYVKKCYDVNPTYLKLKIRWFNNRGMDLGIEETVRIKKSEIKYWHEFKGVQ